MKALSFEFCWWAWLFVSLVVVVSRWRMKSPSAGLVLAYLLQLWSLYGIGGWIYQHEWYSLGEQYFNDLGFEMATYGIIGFGIGSVFVGPFLIHSLQVDKPKMPSDAFTLGLPLVYVLFGLFSFFFIIPIASKIPSGAALSSSMWRFLVAGLCLCLWKAWQTRNSGQFFIYSLFSFIGIPLLTMIQQGFLSYGAMIALSIFSFIANFLKPRWKMIALGMVIIYAGLSFYVTYMRDRELLRERVRAEEATSVRLEEISGMITNFEWLDSNNEIHLYRLDERMNQCLLLGAAIDYMGNGLQPFAHGATLWDSVLSLIPRVLWPDKNIFAGSGNLVADYTGIEFSEGTSVGIGQVLEFYVNFGSIGVFCGMLVMSTLVCVVDTLAGNCLVKGDWKGFLYWYLPGFSMIDALLSMVEVTASAVSGALVGYYFNRYLFSRQKKKLKNASSAF